MSKERSEEQQSHMIALPVKWHVPEHIKNVYADNIVAQARTRDILIAFFEAQVPILGGTPEENLTTLMESGSILAECVGKVIIAPDMVPDMIKVLQAAYDGYMASKSVKEANNG